jgi:leader peptidase (prepilin peptidase)/N-methyltransferase
VSSALVVGCALGGAGAGVVLDLVAAGVRPAPRPEVAPSADGASQPDRAVASATPGVRGAVERLGVPLVTAALFGLAALRIGAEPQLGAYCALFAGLVAMSVVDLRVGLVPRRFVYPTVVLTAAGLLAASAVEGQWRALEHAAIGGAVAFFGFFAIWWVYPKGLGFGDVRLAGLIGLALGWLGLLHLYIGLLFAFVLGALFGLAVMALRGGGRKTRFAFGPALSAGAVIGVLWGTPLVSAWLGHGS